ncbi:MAG: GNAT family N-acetyltransferase [archaeon]|nr:GNAT family N-acetyltransferase [archaeon]
MKKRYVLLAAEIDGRIVGAVEAFHRFIICYINRLAVHPKHQGKGIGSDLLIEICKRLKTRKARFVILCMNPRSDRPKDLIKFYRRHRFKAIGIIFIKRL